MKNILLLLTIPFITLSCTHTPEPVIIPRPELMKITSGRFNLSPGFNTKCVGLSNDDSTFLCTYLADKIKLFSGSVVSSTSLQEDEQEIQLICSKDSLNSIEGAYTLEVSRKKITLTAGTQAGIFYGINTLIQMIPHDDQEPVIPCALITDKPFFSWRGMHLDVSRHYFPADDVKHFIDLLALHKMNVFHWHLTDDQGWRIEIKKYPELTRIGAYRIAGRDIPWNYDQELSFDQSRDLYGGFYTQEDIKEIVAYAKERFITIVPEIEMPGHSQAALTAYPQYSCSGKPYVKNTGVPFEFTHPYCAGKEETFYFLENVLSEVFELFPSEYIHIGGDEANHSPWENCTLCRKRMLENHLENTAGLQAWFIERIDTFIRAHGRKTIGWDEIMDGNLSREAAIMSWRSADQTQVALSAGYNTVSAASEFLYLNRNQDIPGNRPGSELSLESVYSFEPMPEPASPEVDVKLMGINACLWSENIPDLETLEKHLLPRLAAVSTIAWSREWKPSFAEFESTLPFYLQMLDRERVSYWIDSPEGLRDDLFYADTYQLRMEDPIPGTQIRYTIDGSEPTIASEIYTKPVILKESVTIKARVFLPSGKSSQTGTARITRVNLQEPADTTVLPQGWILKSGNADISTLDSLSLVKEWKTGTADSIAIPPEFAGKDHFVLVFDGYFYAPEDGIYHFYTTSDDGSRVYLNDSLLVDNDGIHGYITAEGAAGLRKGYHRMRVEYFEARYGEGLRIEIKGPGDEKLDLTKGVLCR